MSIIWSIRKDVIEQLASVNPAVTVSDVDKAVSAKVKKELAEITFKSRGGDAKLQVTSDLRLRYSDGREGETSAEFKPFAALLRFSNQWDKLVKEFGKMPLGGLPDNAEFKELVLWTKTLKPRTGADAAAEKKPEGETAGAKA